MPRGTRSARASMADARARAARVHRPKSLLRGGKKDPWEKFNSRGDDGGGGGDGGGSDGEEGDGDDFFIGTPDTGRKGLKKAHEYDYGKLFEAKDAKSLPEHKGRANGGVWRKKVSYYIISKGRY